ncbi:MAG: DsrE family protein [Leadbetterella sp.]|jgi:intracellular sulfur oxidation DsrE/DsrF family protein|nr:DsrE family protein [Leadbetterella sp.]MBP8156117.1 DsrE family protein [Leadbetterella sp.]
MKFLLPFLLVASLSAFSQRQFPEIDSFGGVFPIPEAEQLVDPNKKYKVVFDITSAAKNQTTEMNPGFESVARFINLHGLAGVKKENLEIVVVIHFQATPTILSDESFMTEYKEKNPNTEVINKLGENGVKFYVCGQSLRMRKLVDYKRNSNIRVAHGALLALSHFQSQGYSLMTLH